MNDFHDQRKIQPEEPTGSKSNPATPPSIGALETSMRIQGLLKSLDNAYQAIAHFNSKNSAGMELGNVLSGLIFGQLDEHLPPAAPEDKLVLEAKPSRQEIREVQMNELLRTFKGPLDELGLGLRTDPVSAGFFVGAQNSTITSTNLSVKVIDRDKLLMALGSLSANDISDPICSKALQTLASDQTNGILHRYSIATGDDDFLEIFPVLGKFIGQYARLGLSENVEQLRRCQVYAAEGSLREYVESVRKGYFSEPGQNFGPADWSSDCTSDTLKDKWNGALDLLDRIGANPKAVSIYTAFSSHLRRCINHSIENVSQQPDNKFLQQHVPYLESVRDRLTQEATDGLTTN